MQVLRWFFMIWLGCNWVASELIYKLTLGTSLSQSHSVTFHSSCRDVGTVLRKKRVMISQQWHYAHFCNVTNVRFWKFHQWPDIQKVIIFQLWKFQSEMVHRKLCGTFVAVDLVLAGFDCIWIICFMFVLKAKIAICPSLLFGHR